jgi:hypothetical protein
MIVVILRAIYSVSGVVAKFAIAKQVVILTKI